MGRHGGCCLAGGGEEEQTMKKTKPKRTWPDAYGILFRRHVQLLADYERLHKQMQALQVWVRMRRGR
jgi:hypothetical protein